MAPSPMTTGPRTRLPALHEALVPLVVLAAGMGVAFPAAARALRPGVPEMLAAQVAGVALTIPFAELSPVLRRPKTVLAALAVQWATQPLAGLALYHLAGGGRIGTGAFITSSAPAEITSALVAVVAGGTAVMAAALMTASVAAGCVLTPAWLLLLAHGHVDPGGLVPELVLSVAVPLAAGVAVRSRTPRLAAHPRPLLDLSGAGLLLVVFVGAGGARSLLLSAGIGKALLFAALLVLAGSIVAGTFAALAGGAAERRIALGCPIAMREFGIATAVALAIAPGSAGFGGVYGVVMMLGAAAAATVMRRRGVRTRIR